MNVLNELAHPLDRPMASNAECRETIAPSFLGWEEFSGYGDYLVLPVRSKSGREEMVRTSSGGRADSRRRAEHDDNKNNIPEGK